MYKPLPDGLIINKSSIEGQGLFTTKFIEKDVKLGLCHILINEEVIRTPLGGFVNHSDKPNCIKIREILEPKETGQYTNDRPISYTKYFLYTKQPIEGGEELTIKYTFYKVEENTKNSAIWASYNINAPMMDME